MSGYDLAKNIRNRLPNPRRWVAGEITFSPAAAGRDRCSEAIDAGAATKPVMALVRRAHSWIVLSLAASGLLAGCTFFSSPPPLPRRAAIEPGSSDERFVGLVDGADIIYFPREAVSLSRHSDLAWRLLNALQRSGKSFSVGLETNEDAEPSRALQAELAKFGADILPLRSSAESARGDVPDGFTVPPEHYERFAQRPEHRDANPAKLRAAYEAELVTEQWLAQRIARYARDHASDRLLVFVRHHLMGSEHGVPYFVAQKTKARQLVLNPEANARPGPGLMAGSGSWDGRLRRWLLRPGRLQIVDGERFAGGDGY